MNHHTSKTSPVGFGGSDEDINLTLQWPENSEDEGDGKSMASNASICKVTIADSSPEFIRLVDASVFIN